MPPTTASTPAITVLTSRLRFDLACRNHLAATITTVSAWVDFLPIHGLVERRLWPGLMPLAHYPRAVMEWLSRAS